MEYTLEKLSHEPSKLTDLVVGGVLLELISMLQLPVGTGKTYTRNVIKVVEAVMLTDKAPIDCVLGLRSCRMARTCLGTV